MDKRKNSRFTALALILAVNFGMTTTGSFAQNNNESLLQPTKQINSSKNNSSKNQSVNNFFKIKVVGFKDDDNKQYYNEKYNTIFAEDFSQKAVSSLADALSMNSQITTGLTDYGSIDIRGQALSSLRNVQVLVDGVPMNVLQVSHYVPNYNAIVPGLIESIDVLAGSGSVIFGNGTRGGVINVKTSLTNKNFKPVLSFMGTFVDKKSTSLALGLPVLNDRVFIKAQYADHKAGSTKNSELVSDYHYLIQTKLKISDHHMLGYQFSSYEENGNHMVFIEELGQNKQDNDVENFQRDKKNVVHNVIYHGGWGNFSVDEQFFYNEFSWFNKTEEYTSNLYRLGNKIKFKYDYAGFFENSANYIMVGNDTIVTTEKNQKPFEMKYKKESRGFFVMNNIFFLPNTYLKTGFRYDRDLWTRDPYKNKKIHNTAFELLLGHNFSNDINLYVKAESGYTAPDSTAMADYLPEFIFLPKWEENKIEYEKFVSYELGGKAYIPLLNTSVSMSVFNTNTDNEYETLYTPMMLFHTVNLGKTRRTGIDFAVNTQVVPKINVFLNGTYMNTRLNKIDEKKIKNIEMIPEEYQAKHIQKLKANVGKKLDFVPEVSLSFGVQLNLVPGLYVKNTNKFVSSYTDTYIDNSSGNEEYKKATIPSHIVSDLIISYETESPFWKGNWTGFIGIHNLFNKKYVSMKKFKKSHMLRRKEWKIITDQGRTVVVGLKYNI